MELKDIQLFSGMSAVEQARLLGKMNKIQLPSQTLLFEQGSYGDCMYIIVRGSLDLLRGDQHLTTTKEGDILGEMSLLTNNPRSATAITASEVELFEVPRKVFEEALAENSQVSLYFIKLLTDRLIKTNDSMLENKKSNITVFSKRLEALHEEAKNIILWSAILPQPVPLKLWSNSEIMSLESALSLVNDLIRIEKEYLHIVPMAKNSLGEIIHSSQEKEQIYAFVFKAALTFWSENMHLQAVDVLIKYDQWETAIKMIGENLDAINFDLLEQILEKFLPCPNEILFSNPEFFYFLIQKLISVNDQGVLELLQAALGATEFFSQDQFAWMYEKSAEIYSSKGNMKKALEFMKLAVHYAEGPGSLSSTENSTEIEARTFQIAKQNLAGTTGKLLTDKARNVFAAGKPVTVIAGVLSLMAIWCFSVLEPFYGLTREGMLFLGILIGGVILWVTEVIPSYLTALLMGMAWVISGTADPQAALSGFASPSWLFIIFILGLAAAIAKSGLMFRLSLHMLKAFPKTYLGQLLGLAVSGLLFTPLLPSASAKVTLAAPISRSIAEAMRLPDRSDGSAGLAFTALIFYGYLVPFFMTGSYANMMAVGLIKGCNVSLLAWTLYALPALLIFSVIILGMLLYRFRPTKDQSAISSEVLEKQLAILGPLSREEKITLWVALGSIIMMSLQSWHHIDNAWVMLGGFVVLILGKVLDQKTIKNEIDWMFMLFMGIAFSLANVASELGIVAWITGLIEQVMNPLLVSPYLFLPAIIIIIFTATLFIRDDAALILLTLALTPLAGKAGIDPWVLVFIILLTIEPFFFPYQSSTYLMAYYSTGEKAFTHRQGRYAALCYGITVIVSVILSIPYWQLIGLIK